MTGDNVMGGTGTGMQITEVTLPGADFDRWYDVYRAADATGEFQRRL